MFGRRKRQVETCDLTAVSAVSPGRNSVFHRAKMPTERDPLQAFLGRELTPGGAVPADPMAGIKELSWPGACASIVQKWTQKEQLRLLKFRQNKQSN